MIYLNEIDPFCVEWLRNLIKEGHLPDGIVDDRSIEDVTPADLAGFDQCHFFAGIGLWPLSLQRAGVPSTRRLWTGSCPCQPFSAAGEGKGFADERHLWPAWNYLIGQCRPQLIFGEQVASKDGLGWLDLVSADLEGQGYAIGANDLCAAGFGAFHIRQRLWFVAMADPDHAGSQGRGLGGNGADQRSVGSGGMDSGLADAIIRSNQQGISQPDQRTMAQGDDGRDASFWLADTNSRQRDGVTEVDRGNVQHGPQTGRLEGDGESELGGATTFWMEHAARLGRIERGTEPSGRGIVSRCSDGGLADTDGRDTSAERQQRSREQRLHSWRLWPCQDGKYRPIPTQQSFFPLAHGHPGRVGQLRAYGNGIHVETATCFIEAAMTCL